MGTPIKKLVELIQPQVFDDAQMFGTQMRFEVLSNWGSGSECGLHAIP